MGIQWYFHFAMNRPKVNRREVVGKIVEQHVTRPEFQVGDKDAKDVLTFVLSEPTVPEWPSAVRADELPSEAADDGLDELLEERGEQGSPHSSWRSHRS